MATITQTVSTTVSKKVEGAQVNYQYNLSYSRNTEDTTVTPSAKPSEIRVSATFNAPGVSSSISRRYSPDGTFQIGDYPYGMDTQAIPTTPPVIYPFTEAFDIQVLEDVLELFEGPSALETFN